MSRNGFAESRRRLKVDRLLAVIEKLDQPPAADDVAEWTSSTWRALTDTANALFEASHDPPSAASRAMVIEALRERERAMCTCFVPPAGPGVPHERGCRRGNVVDMAAARAARRAS